MYDRNLKFLSIASILTAMTVIFSILFPIPIPSGFLFLGDVFIYLAAILLPKPYAVATAAIGGIVSDILLSYTVYAPFTFVIKPLLVLAFKNETDRCLSRRNCLAPLLGVLITLGGYFFADWFIGGKLGGYAYALLSLPFNALQAGVSGILFLSVCLIFDKMQLKSILKIQPKR